MITRVQTLPHAGRIPRILYLNSFCASASTFGAYLRVVNLARLLKRLADVQLVLVAVEPVDPEGLKHAEEEFGRIQVIHAPARTTPVNRIRHELDPSFLETSRSQISPWDQRILMDRIQQVDAVWVHTMRTANCTGILNWPKGILDIDDLPSSLYRSAASMSGVSMRKLLDLRMAAIWRRRERYQHKRFDVLTVCSPHDKSFLGGSNRIHVVRNGFDVAGETARNPSQLNRTENRLGFIGTFDWPANELGMKWFVFSVWPLVKGSVPDAELRLIGKGSDRFNGLAKDVHGLGYVPDADAEIASWKGLCVPIQIGAGTRIKIAEGFARRIPVVSTSLGAFGYDVSDGREMLIADTASDFGNACVRILTDADLRCKLSESANSRFLKEWTWDAQLPAIQGAIAQCLELSEPACLAEKPSR